MLSNYVSFPVFLISFGIGLLFIYITGPEIKTVYVYPSPQNYLNTQYKDNVNQCFQYKPVETTCPINPFSIKTVPIQ
jgi:hypothetical protein